VNPELRVIHDTLRQKLIVQSVIYACMHGCSRVGQNSVRLFVACGRRLVERTDGRTDWR